MRGQAVNAIRGEIDRAFSRLGTYVWISAHAALSGYLLFQQLFLDRQADLRPLFEMAPRMLAVFVPAVTVQVRGETVSQRFGAALAIATVMVLSTTVFGFTIRTLGPLDRHAALVGYTGMVLTAGTYAAVAVSVSSLLRVRAGNSLLATLACLVLAVRWSPVLPEPWSGLLERSSVASHVERSSRGVADTRDLVYFASVVALALLMARPWPRTFEPRAEPPDPLAPIGRVAPEPY